jgi:UDP-N-acetylmuramoyl-tripeptide--D-alanyl-D-alanine ligase
MIILKLVNDFKEIIRLRLGELLWRKHYQKLGSILRALASVYRSTRIRKTRIVVVAGSLGKSTFRNVLHTALNCPDRHFSISNYGSALAHNVLRIKSGDPHAVIEAGVGGPGWMHLYARFLKPNLVIITSIASDHHRSFATLEHTRNEKVKIIRSLSKNDTVFLNGDDPNVMWMASHTDAKVITFGIGKHNDIRAEQVRFNENGLTFDAVTSSARSTIHASLIGEHMVYPLLAALAVAEYEGLPTEDIICRLADVKPVPSRLELLKSPGGFHIIDDTYKAGIETYFSAIDTLARLPAKRKFLVFGDIDDPPGNYYDCLRSIGSHSSKVVDKVYMLTSKKRGTPLRAAAVSGGLDFDNVVFLRLDLHLAYTELVNELQPGDLLLIKGRQTYKTQRLSLMLMGHKVTCRVDSCDIKLSSCLRCPFVNEDDAGGNNYFINNYVKQNKS